MDTRKEKRTSYAASESNNKRLWLSHGFLRILAIAFTVTSLVVMIKTNEHSIFLGILFTASYKDSSASKFLVLVDAIVCVFSGLSLMLVIYLFINQVKHPIIHFLLFLHDMVMALLMMTGCAAATAIGYVAKYGQDASGWISVCDKVALFCKKTSLSGAMAYCALFCYIALTILSVKKLMNEALLNK